MKNFFSFLAGCYLLFSIDAAQAQDTWQRIYTIMNTSCTAVSGCHGDTTKPIFNADTTADALYDMLVNMEPTNPYADTVDGGYLLVDPGSLTTSFLFRKIAHCPVGPLEMDPQEGDPMPNIEDNMGNFIKLPDSTIELIGAWILAGAPETGVVSVDTIAGNVCITVSARTLPAHEVSFMLTPNPTSEDFSVSYTIENTATVSIELFDNKGAKTNLLTSGNKAPGTHRESFDSNLAKGVYFVRLTINGNQYLKKLVVL
ncbi:MAG: T9SS type A sorting domain-containing protein [Chitinophagales bacterium]|nr:T9SS type A sorting domain-containing protein [Chitinophagales bacterium]